LTVSFGRNRARAQLFDLNAPKVEIRAMHKKIRMLLSAGAVVGLVFGVGLLLAPGPLLRMYGLATDGTGELLARLLGVEFIGFNVATWVARNSDPRAEGSAARAVIRAHLVSETIGALVSAWAASRGLGNPLFWSVVVIYAAFAAGFLWAELALRESSAAAVRRA
jgi:hypothetical protein